MINVDVEFGGAAARMIAGDVGVAGLAIVVVDISVVLRRSDGRVACDDKGERGRFSSMAGRFERSFGSPFRCGMVFRRLEGGGDSGGGDEDGDAVDAHSADSSG